MYLVGPNNIGDLTRACDIWGLALPVRINETHKAKYIEL